MKLNLGCNSRILKGYTNIDFGDYPGVDIKTDVSKLGMIKDETVDVIRASHILEHFRYNDTKRVLDEWHRVLKPGGLLYLSVPSWERAVEIYMKAGLQEWLVYFLYGDQTEKGNYHYTVYDFPRLCRVAGLSGFKDISEIAEIPDSLPNEANCLISTVDHKSISLNAVCVRG